jgi:hypothetical protein
MDEPREELGDKRIPEEKSTTAKAAIQFAAKGIMNIHDLPETVKKMEGGEYVIPLPEAEVIGRISIGNLLFAQGLELIFKLIFIAEGIEDKGFKQHALSERFEKIRELSPLKQNIERFLPPYHSNKSEIAREVVSSAEDAFMLSRYLGLRPGNLKSINAVDAVGLLMALTLSYQGLEQIEAARIIGIDIKKADGSALNEPFTRLRKMTTPED